jgi:hypothetical protein
MSPLARRVQSDATRRRQFEREMMFNALPFTPRDGLNFRALGWALTIIVICAALMGLLTIGAH